MASEWIPVTERLPEESHYVRVLVCKNGEELITNADFRVPDNFYPTKLLIGGREVPDHKAKVIAWREFADKERESIEAGLTLNRQCLL